MSVATPTLHDINGHSVLTSIIRSPLLEPLYFGPSGPANNETAVHTEAVLATPAEHYDHWMKVFGIGEGEWQWCHWGENPTLTNLDENKLRIGDILRVGPEAVFEVTSPRIPCFKLAWRLGQPETVLHQMIQSGRIGFYLRVKEPGRSPQAILFL